MKKQKLAYLNYKGQIMAKYQVAVLGCGAIFSRHLAALQDNADNFEFVGYFDLDLEINTNLRLELPTQRNYTSEDELFNDANVNCVVVLTPSHLHYQQAHRALLNGKHVIIEKPASFKSTQIIQLEQLAAENNLDVFCVLQVRLNQSIELVQRILADNLLGEIRGSALIQRWQRPVDYFSGWRGDYAGCGGVLNEFGIHYLDIMQYLLGVPEVRSAKFYNTKFKSSEVADSAYALLDFGSFGATLEICLAAEPHNIEVLLTILGANGYIKLGGKSLDQVVAAEFASDDLREKYASICQQVLGYTIDNQVTIGACPHHPELYKQIIQNPRLFKLSSTYNVIQLIEKINSLDNK